jgi:dCMP deaminase
MIAKKDERIGHDEYYMNIARAVRKRANCLGSRIGAIIVVGNRIVSTGYNGTPQNTTNCLEGGCIRCANRESFQAGEGYDLCICVHAEQNALLSAARFGIAVQGGTMYSTMRPCFGCTKELLQAHIHKVYYLHEWFYPKLDVQGEYQKLQARFPQGIEKVNIDDPEAEWAVSSLRKPSQPVDDTGHVIS